VQFSTGCGSTGSYLTQYYDNQTSYEAANPVNVIAGVATTDIDAAMRAGGTITGMVTAAATGKPLSRICVQAYASTGPGDGYVMTKANGTYGMSGLPSGSYTVEFSSGPTCDNTGNYITQYYDNQTTYEAANPVSVTAGHTTAGIDDALQTGGIITGTVTAAATGTALSGICVDTFSDSTPGVSVITAANGTYRITGLDAGTYTVEFSAGCGSAGNYVTQYYKNQSNYGAADPVSVTSGNVTKDINDALAVGANMSGTVTAAATGAPLAGICVRANSSSGSSGGEATTASDGTYTVGDLAAGSYTIQFSTGCGNTGNYLTQYYDNELSDETPNLVTVAAGGTVTGIDDALQTGGTVTGKVTAAATGKALSGICVYAEALGGLNGAATTARDGAYSITGLTPGSYSVVFETGCGNPRDYLTQYYDDQSSPSLAASIAVLAGKTKRGIDAAMDLAGTISGTVTAASTGKVQKGICVYVYGQAGSGQATTSNTGTYKIGDLESGSYTVEFSTGCGSTGNFAPQWYDNQNNVSQATPAVVDYGQSTTGIDANLEPGGLIKGTVTAASGGQPISGICVVATQTDNGGGYGQATTSATGTYTISSLPVASYTVSFSSGCGSTEQYFTQYYDGASSLSAATPVATTSGRPTTGIDGSLILGGMISGTVTNADGQPDGSACVSAYDAPDGVPVTSTSTESNGSYTLTGLPTGSYYESVSSCYDTPQTPTQWFDGQPTVSSATEISVTQGSTTSGIDTTLPSPGTITGKVKAEGVGLDGICVIATSSGGAYDAITGSTGAYSLTGLAAGTYTVEFTSACQGTQGDYVPQYYDHRTSASSATPVSVTAGGTTPGIDGNLVTFGAISGTVRSGATPVSGICISAFTGPSDELVGEAESEANGAYTMTGLAPGKYKVDFEDGCGNIFNYGTEYYKGTTSPSSATNVIVSAASTTTGIDVDLKRAATITGTVTAPGGTPASDICVTAYPSGSTPTETDALAQTMTGPDGSYSLTGLAGSVIVEFSPCYSGSGYAFQYYSGSTTPSSATPISLKPDEAVSGIDATLDPPASISGTVTAANGGAPLPSVCVSVFDAGTAVVAAYGDTSSDGTYDVDDLPAGSYIVEFQDCGIGAIDYQTQYYSDASSPTAATTVTVALGGAATGIDAVLVPQTT
jgi:hypothetical protein